MEKNKAIHQKNSKIKAEICIIIVLISHSLCIRSVIFFYLFKTLELWIIQLSCDVGCEKDKKCYDIDESWQEGCVTFTCALLDKGPNYVETKILEYHGEQK